MPARTYKPIPALNETKIQEFWSLIDQAGGPAACWPWLGSRDAEGYGNFSIYEGGPYRAIRVALFLASGKDPSGFIVLHSCDNPPCCNPRHLSPGTDKQNHAFRWKNTRVTGTRNHKAKLSDEQVAEIRKLIEQGTRQTAIAPMFGVSQALISKIARSELWKFGETRTSIPKSFIGGERHPMAKINADVVRQIRALQGTKSQAAIGTQFGVSGSLVNMILKRRIWKEVD